MDEPGDLMDDTFRAVLEPSAPSPSLAMYSAVPIRENLPFDIDTGIIALEKWPAMLRRFYNSCGGHLSQLSQSTTVDLTVSCIFVKGLTLL